MIRVSLALLLPLLGCTGAEDPDKPDRLPDEDRDGYQNDVDCDDTNAAVNPGVARDVCNAIDDDCDREIDEDPDWSWYPDADDDGFGDGRADPEVTCAQYADTVPSRSDCDDSDPSAFPGNDESCDGVDNDCDGAIDEDIAGDGVWYTDADQDGAGDPDHPVTSCQPPTGVVDNALDCDDTDSGDPLFVATTGTGSAAGRIASPMARVQDAMNRSHGCVVVLPGTYRETLVWPTNDIHVISRDGPDTTILTPGTGGGPVVSFYAGQTAASVLEGFTLTGGTGYTILSQYYELFDDEYWLQNYYITFGGGAFIVGASPTLKNLVIRDIELPGYVTSSEDSTLTTSTTDSHGGGIYVEAGSPTLEDIEIRETYAYTGGGAYFSTDADVRARRLSMRGVSAGYAALVVARASMDVENLVIDGVSTESGWGGVLFSDADARMVNATIVESGVAVGNWGRTHLVLRDSIIAGNDYGLLNYDGYDESTYDLWYNDFYDNPGGSYVGIPDPTGYDGNISASPKFTSWSDGDGDAHNDDLTLTRSSPCVNAGDPAREDVDGTRADMGAYGGDGGW